MRAVTLLASALLVACSASSSPSPPARAKPEPTTITLFYTSDEHGWIEPQEVGGQRIGGFTQLLAALTAHEGHCAGALPGQPLPDCRGAPSLLLSGGDNYTGPAISGHFEGDSTAAVMRRLGYRLSAFGNHELDFGPARFASNRAKAGVGYLAANMRRAGGGDTELAEPYALVQRGGISLGVIGVATVHTPEQGAGRHFAGVRFDDPEAVLDEVVPEVWSRGVDAVVVLAHECHEVMAAMVREHPEWKLSFVGAGHCHRAIAETIDGTPVIEPDWRLSHYARVRLSIDKSRPPRERARLLDAELVAVTGAAASATDPELAAQVAVWAKDVDRVMGEVIGFSEHGMERGSEPMVRWILDAWRSRFGVDVAVTTDGALRQELAPGPIQVSSIYSILPFDNELVIFSVRGTDLAAQLAAPMARATGLTRRDGSWAVEPDRVYRVVTTDFLFYGGDGFRFSELDDAPTLTSVSWREPVIEWTRTAQSSEQRPLEALVTPESRTAP